jgi:hypothetical protein
MGSVFDLKLFSNVLVERLIVGHLLDHFSYLLSEVLIKLARCGFCVLDRVMEHGRHQRDEVSDTAGVRKQVRNSDGMVDVRRRLLVFSALRRMLARRELNRSQKNRRICAFIGHEPTVSFVRFRSLTMKGFPSCPRRNQLS